MATQRIDTGGAVTGTSTLNDIGTVRHGGNVQSTRFRAKSIGESEFAGDVIHEGGNKTQKVLSGGTFAKFTVGEYVVKGGNITTSLAGVANTSLSSGAADYGIRRSIHFAEQVRTSFLHSWSWASDKNGAPTYTSVVNTARNNYGTDNEARSSRSAPGRLTYMYGAPNPVSEVYNARTN